MLVLIRQLGQAACDLYDKVHCELGAFVEKRPRTKKLFPGQKKFIAFCLGRIHKSLQPFADKLATSVRILHPCVLALLTLQEQDHASSYRIADSVLAELRHLGRGFHEADFRRGNEVKREEATRLHVSLANPDDSGDLVSDRYTHET